MRFIHAADLHLDSPFTGLAAVPTEIQRPVMQSTFVAFSRIIDAAIENQVDFVLLVGDLFDTPKHSAAATDFFLQQLERLHAAKIPAIISYGNHDFRTDFASLTFPDNVHVFSGQVGDFQFKTKSGEVVDVSGFSYTQRWLTDDLIADFPDRGGADWYIGTWHGALATGSSDHYAPFKLDQLLAKHYDYWALGHIHAPQQLNANPPVLYSGTAQGRNVNESGPHGFQLVESEHGRLVPHFHVCEPIEWTTLTLTPEAKTTVADLVVDITKGAQALATAKDDDAADHLNAHDVRRHDYQVDYTPDLRMVTVNIHGDQLSQSVKEVTAGGALVNRLQDLVKKDRPLTWWPVACHLVESSDNQMPTSIDTAAWQAAVQDVFEQANVIQVAGKLADDPEIADRLGDPKMIEELKKRAIALLKGGVDDED